MSTNSELSARLHSLLAVETALFIEAHPRSATLAADAQRTMISGVPMPWMKRWPGPFPVFVDRADGGHFTDVDGHEYIDFCLGDTGAMAGHNVPGLADAVARRASQGIAMMLPSDDAPAAATELTRRFGMAKWQFAMTATDANRFALRLARGITGRSRIAVIDWCYHGTVDETLAILSTESPEAPRVVSRPGAIGAPIDPTHTTRVVPFNDLDALDQALSHGDVACLLMEPALTNIGIVLPEPGYLEGVRRITRKHDVVLIIDETHTICAGPGGCTAAWGLEPDMLTIGKPIGGGVPVAVYGMSDDIARRVEHMVNGHEIDVSGIGGTLSGNALAVAAIRATLATTLRDDDYARMTSIATRWTDGVRDAYTSRGLDWHVQQLGCRAEYLYGPPPRNGAEAEAAMDKDLDAYLHLFMLNRGILMTPFHNMALICPRHTESDADRHTEVFNEALDAVFGA